MDMPISFALALMGVCVLLSAFFSGCEAAFLSLQQIRLRQLVEQRIPGAQQVLQMTQHPERLLATVLLGNNLVNTGAAALGTFIALQIFEDPEGAVVIATVAVTFLLLIWGETLPKTIATAHPERVAFLFWRPLLVVEWLFTPVGGLLHALGRFIRRLVRAPSPSSAISEADIRRMISWGHQEGTVEPTAAEMLERVFRFGDRQVREVMSPRTEITSVERGTSLADFLQMYTQHSHTRFPVHVEHADNVLGILSVKDVLRAMAEGSLGPQDDVTTLVGPAYFVPETKPIPDLLKELQQTGHQMAIIIDEYGGTAGLVTLRQLVEELVGHTGDEGAPEDVRALDERTFKVDASIRIEEANERLGLDIPEGEYETLAGYILSVLGHIPHEGERLAHNSFQLVISEVTGVRIESVIVIAKPSPTVESR